MRELVYVEPGRTEWRAASAPRLQDESDVIVRPVAASACDLDRRIIRGQTPLQGPFALGHECVAEVVDAGEGCDSLVPGDLVVVPFHIACGTCDRCRRGVTHSCRLVPQGAMFGLPVGGEWGGLFSDLVRVPFGAGALTPVPAGVTPADVAAASDNLSLAWEVVAPTLTERPGARVVVYGSGSVGLYAVDVARCLGAEAVVYVDGNADRMATARRLGAQIVEEPTDAPVGEFDLAVDASGRAASLRSALRSLVPEGRCESIGVYFEDVSVPALDMFMRGVTFRIARGNALHWMRAVLDAVAEGRLHPGLVTTGLHDWEDAAVVLPQAPLKPVFLRS